MKGWLVTLSAFLGAILIAFVWIALSNCADTVGTATVTGRVSYAGRPVAGQILFRPYGETPESTGPPVLAELDNGGGYELELKTTGFHRIEVNPRGLPENIIAEVTLAWWRNVKAGPNEIDIFIERNRPRNELTEVTTLVFFSRRMP